MDFNQFPIGNAVGSTNRSEEDPLLPKGSGDEDTTHKKYVQRSTRGVRVTYATPPRQHPIACYFNMTTAFIGGGLLALPYGIKEAGLWAGFAGILIFALLACYTLHLLVKLGRKLEQVCETHAPLRSTLTHATRLFVFVAG